MAPLFFYFSQTGMLRALDCDQVLGLDTAYHGGPSYSAWDVDKVASGDMDTLDSPGGPMTLPGGITTVRVKASSEHSPKKSRAHSDSIL
jgi:hypothetical protein